ncbi:hypothetical protein PS732_02113 [Pseudomonas fluorescens]|uniref:Uncharacterized protein n=1 Tax=Pseudomonas fluorescens TaxID=294 RepID=A0ABD7VEJ3_PSEFL|nr:hypothetical protein PS732_02113 [Pseudomonas fluorescens]
MQVSAKQAGIIQGCWVNVTVDFKIHQTETKFARNVYRGEYIMRLPLCTGIDLARLADCWAG